MKEKYFFKLNKKKGYTIIETMIAVSLFLVVITTGMNALLNASVVQQKSQDIRGEIDNLSFIIEDMSRNLRTGSQYYCITNSDPLSNVDRAKSSPGGQNCWGIAFEASGGSKDDSNDQWVYFIDNNGVLWKSTRGPYNNIANFTRLTPVEVTIDSRSGFYILGAEPPPGDSQQPFVIIRLTGKVNYGGVDTLFSLQTSVSQRSLDI